MSPRRRVDFVDTSVLLELLAVPGKSQRVEAVRLELRERIDAGIALILPTAAVIETGNHIHHVSDGRLRRSCAERFAVVLEESARGTAPWTLHDATWDWRVLDTIRTGAGTGMGLVDHATRGDKHGLGCGDLSVLAERELYRTTRVDPTVVDVGVWCADTLLESFALTRP